MRKKLVVFLLGLVACMALPPISLWPFMLAAFAAHFFILNTVHSENKGLLLSYIFGVGYFVGGLYWIANATLVDWHNFWWAYPFALIGLPLLLALFWGVAGYVTVRFSQPHSSERYILYILSFSITEWLRGVLFTGFPWNLPGYAWDSLPQMLQITSIGGIYLLSLFTIAAGVSIGSLIACRRMKNTYRLKDARNVLSVVFIIILPCIFVFGSLRMPVQNTTAEETAFLVVQPNIAQKIKWEPEQIPNHISTLLQLSDYNAEKYPSLPTKQLYIVWPETALSQPYIDHSSIREKIVQSLESWPVETELFAGVIHIEKDKRSNEPYYYNSIYHLGSHGQMMARYDKTRLVPFGEYMPLMLDRIVTPITGFQGFRHGENRQPFITADGKNIYPLICYETIFPQHIAPRKDNTTSAAMLSITDDSWYGNTSGPYQHNAIARVRAIEQGIPIIRAANTGVSDAFDVYGRQIGSPIAFDTKDAALYFLPKPIEKGTFFAQYHNLIFYIFLIGLGGLLTWEKHKKTKNP